MNPRFLATVALTALLLPALVAVAQDTKPSTQPSEGASSKPEGKLVYALINTTKGDILLELNNEKAPITVANFVQYANDGFYDGTIFHRVIDDFMIQGGGLTADMQKKQTRGGIKNEWKNGLSNMRGTVAMARLGGQPDSATAQFFINVADNTFLDQARDGAAYAVFGRVVGGMDTVDKIRGVETGYKAGRQDVPIETITIEKVKIVPADEAKKHMDKEGATTKPG